MKRSIIILIALVLLTSLSVFASTPEEENAPVATSEDAMFLDMTQLSEVDLMGIEGNLNCAVAGEGGIPELPPPPPPPVTPSGGGGGGYFNDPCENPGGVLRVK
ncbi:MAG: hypothetical protein NUV32_10635 [Exilispira sp.]|jgi:hypothetical protein|nr:hypothetical protein [Exilispira sp.]